MKREERMKIYKSAANELLSDLSTNMVTVARQYGIDRRCFANYLRKNNIDYRREIRSKKKTEKLIKATKLHQEGLSICSAAKAVGISRETLGRYLKKRGLSRTGGYDRISYEVNEDYFEKIDSADKAYWYGMLMADGCVRKHDGNNMQLTLELSNVDYNHLRKFKEAIEFSGPIISRKNRPISCVRVSRFKMCKDLSNKGCVPNKTVEGWIDESYLNGLLRYDFLRGFLDGDGYIDKKRCRVIFTVKSELIRDSLMRLMKEFNPRVIDEETFYRVNVEGKEDFYNLLSKLYVCSGETYLERKKAIAMYRLFAHWSQQLFEGSRG